jgi:hypothetical protein
MRAALIILFLASTLNAEDIPLKEIWAADMPGTRNIRELEPRTEGDHRKYGPLMHEIYKRLQRSEGWGRPDAGAGFAVSGSGTAALNAAYDTLVDRSERREALPSGEASLIFYARRSPMFCYLEEIQRVGNVIMLHYGFTAHRTGNITSHFAIIPLGKLSPGKYTVRLEQRKVIWADSVTRLEPLKDELVKQIVSQPFSFEARSICRSGGWPK